MDTGTELPRATALSGHDWRPPEGRNVQVRSPHTGKVVGTVVTSTQQDLDAVLTAARTGAERMANLPGYERAALLRRIADAVDDAAEDMAQVMARETGKAITDCRSETTRVPATLRLCAEEAVRIEGEHIPMDSSAIGAGKLAMMLKFPIGVVAAITPFNGPVNLAAHKLGPALAAGNSVVLKPSPKAPLSVHRFVEAILEADLPEGALNVLHGDEVSANLVQDDRVDCVSFTGSIPVGKAIKQTAGMKRVALELGGVGPTFVSHDADLATAAGACARHAMALAGQSCASVQNVYVDQRVHDEFMDLLLKEIQTIRFGDPLAEDTEVGTLIDAQAATRVMGMVTDAVERGAQAVSGSHVKGASLDATVLTRVDKSMRVMSEEIFGPVVTVSQYTDIAPILSSISESRFGLQCGIFTDSLDLAMQVVRGVRTGGIIINGTSRWRSDQMPYGGVKDSGTGREGPKFTIREMTEDRLVVFN